MTHPHLRERAKFRDHGAVGERPRRAWHGRRQEGHITFVKVLGGNARTSEGDAMAYDDTAAGVPAPNWPQVRSGPLMVGGILIGIGAVIALAGMAVAGTHVAAATREWIKDLETPPDQLARLKWEQAKSAVAAGATTWQKHPNAHARLARRVPAGVD
jgi:hypothetical protein